MDINQLNQDLIELILKRNELSRLDYNNPEYDDVEEELHDMEDTFVDRYGDYLEKALGAIHDDICPDNDVLLPIAYLAKQYAIQQDEESGAQLFIPPADDGVIVDVENYDTQLTRLVIVPNPPRIILQVNAGQQEEMWRAEEGWFDGGIIG